MYSLSTSFWTVPVSRAGATPCSSPTSWYSNSRIESGAAPAESAAPGLAPAGTPSADASPSRARSAGTAPGGALSADVGLPGAAPAEVPLAAPSAGPALAGAPLGRAAASGAALAEAPTADLASAGTVPTGTSAAGSVPVGAALACAGPVGGALTACGVGRGMGVEGGSGGTSSAGSLVAATRRSWYQTSADLGRWWDSLRSRRSTTGPSAPRRRACRGGSFTIAFRTSNWALLDLKGGSPSTAKYRVAPSAHRSVAGPTSSPLICSGAMNAGEPTTTPVTVSSGSPVSEAVPKSVSLVVPSSRTSTLLGFTSRWTIPARCAASRVASSRRPTMAARRGSSGPLAATNWSRVGASTSSMTM